MTFDDLAAYFEAIPEEIFSEVPDIVAETAVEYFKESFTLKEFDGKPWEPAKVEKKTGSLMVESGNLVNSITAAVITRERLVVSAGNDKVDYAQPHNEGFTGNVIIPAHTRNTKKGPVEVKEHSRYINLPQRQFLGKADELAKMIKERIDEWLKTKL